MSKAGSREVGRIFSLGFKLQPPSSKDSPLRSTAFKAVVYDQRKLAQVTEAQFRRIGNVANKIYPLNDESPRPEHRVRLTPNHLAQYFRINTTHRIALLHVGTAVYRPSRRTPASDNQVMLWRSGITFREPAFGCATVIARLCCRRCFCATINVLRFSDRIVRSLGGLTD